MKLFNIFREKLIDTKLVKPYAFFLLPISFIMLMDLILAYIFPIIIDSVTHNEIIVGAIMSFSAVIGLVCDFVFPIIFAKRTWRFLLVAGIVIALTFPLTIYLGDVFGLVWMLFLATTMWGVYYELLNFSTQSFIADEENPNSFANDWSIYMIIYNALAVIAPIVGGVLLQLASHQYLITALTIGLFALLFSFFAIAMKSRFNVPRKKSTIVELASFLKEFKYWGTLTRSMVSVLILSFFIQFISTIYSVFGGLFGVQLIGQDDLSWIIVVTATIPFILASLILSRLRIKRRKKRLSQYSLLLSGIFLLPLPLVTNNVVMTIVLILISSVFLAFAWPLNEAVYSDLEKRLEGHKIHLIGLQNACYSIAYAVTPIVFGFLIQEIGYHKSFMITGLLAIVIAILLLIFTPKKLRMPRKEMSSI